MKLEVSQATVRKTGSSSVGAMFFLFTCAFVHQKPYTCRFDLTAAMVRDRFSSAEL
jgi:hypothetical protein